MYKVFLVDDEELVIKSLRASVNWNEYGFEVAGYALSGAEAFEGIANIQPDVVFTDIRMPGMSGLELIKNLKDTFSRALFIVVSGYAEFAFAQKAINYGAFGYCLKPFDDTEIIGYLKKAKVILEDRETSMATDILDFIEENNDQARVGLSKALILSGIDMESKNGIKAVVSIGKVKLKLYGLQGCITLRIGFGKYAYLIQDSLENHLYVDSLEAATNGIKGIGASGVIHKVDQIKTAIHEAEIKAYLYFTKGKEYRFSDEAADLSEKDYSINKLVEATGKSDMVALCDLLDEMGALFANGHLHMKHALIVYNHIMSFAHNSEEEQYEEFIYSYDQLASLFGTALDMLLFLKGLLTEKLKTNNEWRPLHTRNRTFNAIFKYINENYCNDISIPSISKQFNVNANYVSQLFKKEVGTTFTEFLAKLRVDYACQLLTTTDLAMNEIAEKAGYDDYFYFSRIFKRMKGKTPSAYRAGQ